MEKKLCIIACNSIAPEISHLIQSEGYNDITLKSYPAQCNACKLSSEMVSHIIGDHIADYSKIYCIVSNCFSSKDQINISGINVEIIRLEQCFEILFNRSSIYHLIRKGYYLVSNGWLRNYKHHIKEWGFDIENAKRFFNESMKKIMLLDTELPGDYMNNLSELSEFMGLPYEVFPVGNSHIKSFIDSLILSWRNESEQDDLNNKISKIAREAADFSLMFHQLQKLIDHTDEDVIVNEIAILIDLLFMPEQILYKQYLDGHQLNEKYCKTSSDNDIHPNENSFLIELKHRNILMGSFDVLNIRFPKFISEYENLGQIISQFGGLSIENARKYSEISNAKRTIEISEQHFRTIFQQAPLGIAIINSTSGKIIDVNSKFAEIVGRSKQELLLIDWMSITHPDDVQEDLNNMAQMNAGNISGFHMYKRYFKPGGEIVWINMTIASLNVNDQKNPVHLCMIEDVTEQRKLEDEIKQSERRFKAIMLQSPSVIELYDLNGLQIGANKAYEELWGFPVSHTLNKFNILKSEEVVRTGLINYVKRAYNGESVVVPDYKFDSTGKTEGHGKGRVRWLSTRIYPLKDNNEKVSNVIVTHEDITLKKLTEFALAANASKFKQLSESGRDMLTLQTVTDIYNYLTTTLHAQYPNAVILFSTVDEYESNSMLVSVKGISDSLFEKARKLTGFNFIGKKYKLLPLHSSMFRSGKFIHFKDGLAEFSGGEFPVFAAKAIEKLVGISNIYTIGINKDDKLYAIIHFFARNNSEILDNEYIESFVKQAAILIERKILEELLTESEKRYRFIAENMSDVIWSLSLDSLKFTYISPSVTNLTGFTVEEAMEQTIEGALDKQSAEFVLSELPKRIADYYEGKFERHVTTYELRQRRKDGSCIWVEFTTMFKINQEGRLTEILGITRNINERKIAELEIQAKNQELSIINAEKDKYFSIIAHDLRSPLASIVSLSELMVDQRFDLSIDEIKEYAGSLYRTANSTYNLLENLLEWSMHQRGHIVFNPGPIDLTEFFENCDETIMELAYKKSINIEILDPDQLTIYADLNMLKTVMRNLVSNAIKFTNSGGTINIRTFKTIEANVQFEIEDSGIGMESNILENLFQIDKNVSRPGTNGEPSTGLGLILSKEFVGKHGGKIWATSTVNKGSIFYFTLPLFHKGEQLIQNAELLNKSS